MVILEVTQVTAELVELEETLQQPLRWEMVVGVDQLEVLGRLML